MYSVRCSRLGSLVWCGMEESVEGRKGRDSELFKEHDNVLP